MRVIDIDPILAWANDPEVHEPYGVRGSELVRKLWDAPIIETIDAVSVVRCKECRYWEMRNSPRGWCVVHQGYVSPQYFCADGEVRDE